jgi:hypothetical protein
MSDACIAVNDVAASMNSSALMNSYRNSYAITSLCLLSIVASAVMLTWHISLGALFLMPPLIVWREQLAGTTVTLAAIFFIKIIHALFSLPGAEYGFYLKNYTQLGIEVFTVAMFFLYVVIGKFIGERFLINRPYFYLCAALGVWITRLPFDETIFLHGVDSTQIIIILLLFLSLNRDGVSAMESILSVLFMIFLSHKFLSTFTSLSAICLLCFYVVRSLGFNEIRFPGRKAYIFMGLIFTFASFVAPYVHLKDDDITEGNNGFTRSYLADKAFETIELSSPLGTPMARGIVPVDAVIELGWDQYFYGGSGAEDYNIYSLSFHNGFIYMISRYGVLALLMHFLVYRLIPREIEFGGFLLLLLCMISISANVVVESIRAGPGVGLAIGVALSMARFNIANKKVKF